MKYNYYQTETLTKIRSSVKRFEFFSHSFSPSSRKLYYLFLSLHKQPPFISLLLQSAPESLSTHIWESEVQPFGDIFPHFPFNSFLAIHLFPTHDYSTQSGEVLP